jgi:hypothetical protein
MEPPDSPISNILLPTKRFENYKRSFNNQHRTLIEQHNFEGSITENTISSTTTFIKTFI